MRSSQRIAFAALCLFSLPAACPGQNTCDGPVLGTNLGGVKDYTSATVFVDVFKAAREWIPQTEPLGGPWNTGEPIATDADGWVASLDPGQAAANVLITEQGDNYPSGQYICLYDGEGTLEFLQNASIVSQQPGRIVVQIDPTPTGLTWMRITQTNPADPVRNIRLIMPGFESTHAQQLFHPDYLQSLSPYKVIRYMEWQKTNNSTQQHWADRPTPQTFSQNSRVGVSIEYMIELSNRVGADPWFCMPHLATDDYITQFATLVRDTLDPSLTVYIEHSNEVWNGLFNQVDYASQQGLALGFSTVPWQAAMRYHAHRSVQIFQIWESVFGSADRLVRVIGGFHISQGTSTEILDWNNAYQSADALATAPYFSYDQSLTVTQLEQMTVDQILDNVEQKLLDPQVMADEIMANTALAETRGLKHIAYEGGQSIVDFANSDNETLVTLFTDANRHPRMRDLYDTYLPMWRDNSNGGLFMHFVHIGRYGPNGSWGAMEKQSQDPATAYKLLALIDFESAYCRPGDFDGDGAVNVADLLQLLAAWGPCLGCPEDIDGDGEVNVADLLQLLMNWN